jgi:hypothetical protein
MTTAVTAPKSRPEDIARAALDGIEADVHEVLADDTARGGKAAVSGDLITLYPELSVASSN